MLRGFCPFSLSYFTFGIDDFHLKKFKIIELIFEQHAEENLVVNLVLHCASLLRTIFASSARAHERVHVQNVGDFPQTKLDNGINSPFLFNEHGDPRFFLQVFAKNSVMNIFEEEKKFDSRT